MTPSAKDDTMQALSEDTWRDVIAAMDRTYSGLVDYQELLEKQNRSKTMRSADRGWWIPSSESNCPGSAEPVS